MKMSLVKSRMMMMMMMERLNRMFIHGSGKGFKVFGPLHGLKLHRYKFFFLLF